MAPETKHIFPTHVCIALPLIYSLKLRTSRTEKILEFVNVFCLKVLDNFTKSRMGLCLSSMGQKSGLCHIFIPTVMDHRFLVTETHNTQSKKSGETLRTKTQST